MTCPAGDIFGCYNKKCRGESAIGIQWVEARNAVKHHKRHMTPPQKRISWSKMSAVLSLRNPGTDEAKIGLR